MKVLADECSQMFFYSNKKWVSYNAKSFENLDCGFIFHGASLSGGFQSHTGFPARQMAGGLAKARSSSLSRGVQ